MLSAVVRVDDDDETTLLWGKESLRVKGVGGETDAIVKGDGAVAPPVGEEEGGVVAVKATMTVLRSDSRVTQQAEPRMHDSLLHDR